MWIKWRKLWKTLPIFFEISRSAGSYMPYGHQIFPLFAARWTTNTQARDLFPVSRTKLHQNTRAAAASAPPRGKLSLPGALIPFARTAPVHIKASVRALKRSWSGSLPRYAVPAVRDRRPLKQNGAHPRSATVCIFSIIYAVKPRVCPPICCRQDRTKSNSKVSPFCLRRGARVRLCREDARTRPRRAHK